MVRPNTVRPGKRAADTRSSLFGPAGFRPHVAIVLAVLTLTIIVVGFRITRNSGLRRVEKLVRDGQGMFERLPAPDGGPRDPATIEARIRTWTGARIVLPRDEGLFTYLGVTRAKIGRKTVAAVRLSFAGDRYLLLVMRRNRLEMAQDADSLFSRSGFLSGERDGISFVFWERGGAAHLVLTNAALERAFDLVRRYFS